MQLLIDKCLIEKNSNDFDKTLILKDLFILLIYNHDP